MSHPSGVIAGIPYPEVLALEGFPDGSGAPVYLSGSIVTPYANAWSDVDVYVIADRTSSPGMSMHDAGVLVSQHFVRDRRVDYEFWHPSSVDRLIELTHRLPIGLAEGPTRSALSRSEEVFLHRLRVGRPLHGVPAFETCRASLAFERLARYQCQETIRELDGVYDDVCGMLDADHLDVAELSARELARLTTIAYVHGRGSTDPGIKWLPRHLEAVDDGSARHREFVDTHWQLQYPRQAGPGAAYAERRAYVEACIAFSRAVVSWLQN